MKRSKLLYILILAAVLCTACGTETGETENSATKAPAETTDNEIPEFTPEPTSEPVSVPEEIAAPTTNEELFSFVTDCWKNGETDEIYEFAGEELQALMGKEDFAGVFESLSEVGGELLDVTDVQVTPYFGTDVYTSVVEFENVTLDLQVSLSKVKITGFTYNIHFKDAFEVKHENGIVEKYFVFESAGCKLNAVYTYSDDGEKHPAVLLIAGSGPSDYNESIGLLAPFQDIALGLAQRGVNSIRVDKRTLRASAGTAIGLEEEYYADCRAAIEFLKEQEVTNIYLLGHSLGGQIAPRLAAEDPQIAGMILFNSTPRHLADLACDQYKGMDPKNEELYVKYAEAAKAVREDNIQGAYYYGADDYYWATYNDLDVIADINDAGIRTLIINSMNDAQIFRADMDVWNENFADQDNVSIHIYDDISHFGYKIDATDTTALYRKVDFPEELLDEFAEFCE